MAIAIRMAMINTTTINSMRVNPSSASFRRATNERTAFTVPSLPTTDRLTTSCALPWPSLQLAEISQNTRRDLNRDACDDTRAHGREHAQQHRTGLRGL